MRKQGLLKSLHECEYPAEYLVARLLGKKGALFSNWEFLMTGSDALESLHDTPFYPYLKKYAAPGIWRFLRHEYYWVYSKMNPFLRKIFSPYFIFHEINILIICLRYLSRNKDIERIRQELHNSLLHDDIQAILTGNLEFTAILSQLELRLNTYSDLFKGLAELYEKKGITGLEIFIRDCFFHSILAQKQPDQMQTFFRHMVDLHNSMSLAKNLRWQSEVEPTITPGGTIPAERFKRAYFRKDLSPVIKFLRLQVPAEVASDMQKLEITLLSLITQKLKSRSLQRTVVGDILFYLWEQYRYTRNISMVLNTTLLDDEPVRENLVA